jgi:hypothetical protein
MDDATAGDDGLLPVEVVVPPRSVLTELARGFLLTREGDGRRAARFATTFLRERDAGDAATIDALSASHVGAAVSFARRHLGLLPHGAVERPSVGLRA